MNQKTMLSLLMSISLYAADVESPRSTEQQLLANFKTALDMVFKQHTIQEQVPEFQFYEHESKGPRFSLDKLRTIHFVSGLPARIETARGYYQLLTPKQIQKIKLDLENIILAQAIGLNIKLIYKERKEDGTSIYTISLENEQRKRSFSLNSPRSKSSQQIKQ